MLGVSRLDTHSRNPSAEPMADGCMNCGCDAEDYDCRTGRGMYGAAASDHTCASFQINARSNTSEHADCVATEYIVQFVALLLFHSNTCLILPCAASLPRLPQHR